MSWNANGSLDEEYVMANIGERSEPPYLLWSKATGDILTFQTREVFLTHRPQPQMRLYIQLQVPSGTLRRPSVASHELCGEALGFRLLSCRDTGKTSQIPYTYWEVYDDLVSGVCDVHTELLGEVLDLNPDIEYYSSSFPWFKGTQDQFADCLEQVKKEIQANKRNQLSPSQQINMLELVEKHFQDYWTIVSPETLSLSQITLGQRSKYEGLV